MTVSELFQCLNARIPASLSCDWDNDGLMCCPDPDRSVRRVLVCLDATAKMAEKAVAEAYDVILTHHPLVFHKLPALNPSDPVAKKLIRLTRTGIAVMSFHTRLDAVSGGVNDCLAAKLALREVTPFGKDGIGRIGYLPEPMPLSEFAGMVKRELECPGVTVSDAGKQAYRVAVLGGSGSDDVQEAQTAGADTYLSGEIAYHHLIDAPERGMNLVAAGHFYTEQPICEVLAQMVRSADDSIQVEVFKSNSVLKL